MTESFINLLLDPLIHSLDCLSDQSFTNVINARQLVNVTIILLKHHTNLNFGWLCHSLIYDWSVSWIILLL